MYKTTLSVLVSFLLPCLVWAQAPQKSDTPPRSAETPSSAPEQDIPEDAPILQVDNEHLKLGTIKQGVVAEFSYQLTNAGKSTLIIDKVRRTCGCTVAKLTKSELAPGETVTLSATFNSAGRSGKQKKTLTVHSNDPRNPQLKLSFEAEIEVLYRANPPRILSFRQQRRGTPLPKPIQILPGKADDKIEILDIQFDKPGLTSETSSFYDEKYKLDGVQIDLTLGHAVPLGVYSALVTVRMRVGEEEITAKFTRQRQGGSRYQLPAAVAIFAGFHLTRRTAVGSANHPERTEFRQTLPGAAPRNV